MIKITLTAIESNEDGSAVTLFEDYKLAYDTTFDIDALLGKQVVQKIEEVEKEREEQSKPF